MAAAVPELPRLLASIVGREDEIADRITQRIRREVDELQSVDDPKLWDAIRDSTVANIRSGMSSLAGSRRLPNGPPVDAGQAARIAAGLGVSLAALLRAYRVAHAVLWSEWMAAVEGLGLPPAERFALLENGSRFLFDFVDHLATLVTREFERERTHAAGSRAERRRQLVRDLLEGVLVDASDLEYDLGLQHVGLVVRGERAETAVRALAADVDARLLLVPDGDEVWWGWLGSRAAEWTAGAPVAALGHVPCGLAFAFGEVATGPSGFRRTHREAREADRVARLRGDACASFGDVALEALVSRDHRQAQDFVERELAGIDGSDERSRRLRETLRTYIATGHNAASAAAILGVHDQTVSYRLRTVEDRLGRSLVSRRTELEVALRLEALLRP